MELVKKYLLRLPDENVILTKDELVSRVKDILKDHPSEHMNAYRVWYEGFEGCGMPGTDVYDVIVETMRSMTGDWKDIGPMRWEKYGVVNPSFLNLNYDKVRKTDEFGNDMLQHRFHLGKHYQGPDGRVFWIPVMEDYNMRAFERKDGKYVGTMVEIDPRGDYAKAMVEVQV
ncbi:MAG: hypothetical protein IJ072_03975 [Oscillospiraceae bacterium]|nr:hypothetical protein [Oscillospiraceae bacterium]